MLGRMLCNIMRSFYAVCAQDTQKADVCSVLRYSVCTVRNLTAHTKHVVHIHMVFPATCFGGRPPSSCSNAQNLCRLKPF